MNNYTWETMVVEHAFDAFEYELHENDDSFRQFIDRERTMQLLEELYRVIDKHGGPIVITPFITVEKTEKEIIPRHICKTVLRYKELQSCWSCKNLLSDGVCKLTMRHKGANGFCDEWERRQKK